MRSSRRLALADLSDDEEEQPRKTRRSPPSYDDDQRRSRSQRKRKNVKLYDYEDEEEEIVEESKRSTKSKQEQQASGSDDGDDGGGEDEDDAPDAKPIGDYVRVSGKGRKQRHHYEAFEYDGTRYELEDSVLLVPEEKGQKPYVAIIKDITQSSDGNMMVLGQWFYRPEEAEKKGGGNWKSSDTRELFYSFHRDEVPAESVMHKCVVHFIPLNKQIPKRKQHPGFIVQRVYDTVERRLFKLTDKDYEDNKQHEIDLLVQKTFSRVGDIPDIETEGDEAGQEDQMRNKRLMKRKMMSPLDVSRVDEETSKSGQFLKAETPGSCNSIASEYHTILGNFKVLTGDTQRDRWLERLLQGVRYICGSSDNQEASQNGRTAFPWPVAAVPCIVALEKESHESFSSDFQKYNKKMRQLQFNLKSNAQLARRLLNGELEPAKILNMSHIELKEGLTAEEIASNKPEESVEMQVY